MLHLCYSLKRQGIEAEYDANLARQGLDDFFLELPGGKNTYVESLRGMASSLYEKALSVSGKSRFLDKTPRYFYIIPELKRIFPRAKFVFLLRNPLAILSSVLRSWFNGNPTALRASPYHHRDLYEGPAYLTRGIEHLGDDAIVLQYEELVSNPAANMQKLCQLLELPYEDRMPHYGDQDEFRGRFGDQIGIRRHQAPVTDSIVKWMKDLLDPEVCKMARQYLDHLGAPLLSQMGYTYDELSAKLDEIVMEGLKRGMAMGATATPTIRAQYAISLCEDGEVQFSEGRLDAAATNFLEAARIDPRAPRAYNNIGVMLWNEGEQQMASQYAAMALASSPDDRTAVLNYGDMMVALGKPGVARAVYWNYMLGHPQDEEVAQRYLIMPDVAPEDQGATENAADHMRVTPDNFSEFTYSRRSHFSRLQWHDSQRGENIDDCNLKVYQDMLAYNFVLDNFPEGARLLDIGGGDSCIIRWLKDRYEFWNLDKLEGLGNGLTGLDDTSGFKLVQDYIGAFSKEIPDDYFDGIFSISTLEHVPEDDATLRAICDDMDRLLKPGGLSMHCFDVLIKREGFWVHRLVDYLYGREPILNTRAPDWKMRVDPDLWGMTQQAYDRLWKNTTQVEYEKFGMPISYNLIWRKALES